MQTLVFNETLEHAMQSFDNSSCIHFILVFWFGFQWHCLWRPTGLPQ